MKLCLACHSTFSRKEWECPACGHQPGRTGNFPSFAPEFATFNEHFPPDSFQRLAPLEEDHFWFRARNELIIWAIRKWFAPRGKLMEVGCGTGYVLSRIEKEFPQMELCGGEIYDNGLEFAARRLTRAQLLQVDALHIPYREEFNLIGLFDTLEHVQKDEEVLAEIHRALAPGGGLLLTVPQHGFLWSYQDEFSGHARRYERNELVQKTRRAGFQVLDSSSFVFLLLPLLWASRMGKQKPVEGFDSAVELKLHPLLNTILGWILVLERFLIQAGLRFTWGGSLLLIARKV